MTRRGPASALLEVLVTPRASSERVGGWDGQTLRVHVTRPPAEGEANRAVSRLLARLLEVPPGRVQLVAGERSRRKRFRVEEMRPEELSERLAGLAGD